MRKLFLALLLIFALPAAASAQQIALPSVRVSLWPEFDQPSMLAIYYITLDSQNAFPLALEVRIPAAASLHTVAVGASPETVSDQNVQYDTRQDGEWKVVSIQATGPAIQIEYYDPALQKKGAARAYQFRWQSDYDVNEFSVVFQQPFDASNFKSAFILKDEGVAEDGLRYYSSDSRSLKAGESVSFALSYEKASDALSLSQINMPVEPAAPLDANAPGRVSAASLLPYLVGGAGAALIFGGLFYYWRSGASGGGKKKRRRANRLAEEDGDVYCSQCGTRARGGDRFCRSCGSRLRRAED